MGVSWTDEQRQAIDNRGGTLLVSAAAGSGKTAVLVQRVLDRVTDSENPCDVDSFLIVTFTKAAASEMRGKIADALTELAAKQPQNLRLRRQLMLVHRAKITTVHAFCMSLVKEHFHELGLPPEFRTADDSEQTAMQQEVLEEVLEAQYAVDGAGFSALVEAVSGGRDDRQLASLVLETFRNLQSSPKPKKELEQYRQKFVQEFDRIANTDWGMALLQEADSRIQYSIAALEDALDEMNGADVVQDKYEPVFAHDKQQAENLLALVRDGAWDAAVQLCAQLRGSFKRIPAIRGYEDKDFLEQLKNRRNIWKDMVKEMADKVLCVTEQEVREDMHMMAPAVCALCDTVQLFMDAYQAEKLRRGVVDFNTLRCSCSWMRTMPRHSLRVRCIFPKSWWMSIRIPMPCRTPFSARSAMTKKIFLWSVTSNRVFIGSGLPIRIFSCINTSPIGTQKPYPMMRRGAWCFPKISVPALRCWTASIICFLP